MRKKKVISDVAAAAFLEDKVYATLRTSMNFVNDEFPTDLEIPYGVSLCIPDQTLPIREQLRRFNGGPMTGLIGQFTDPDDDGPDFSKMDPIEIIQWREDALERLELVNERFRVASAELAAKQDDERIQAAAEALLLARQIPDEPQP